MAVAGALASRLCETVEDLVLLGDEQCCGTRDLERVCARASSVVSATMGISEWSTSAP